MKHEVTTLQTKKLIADALKRRMSKEPLSKITVTNIVTDCGINRNTFYYHFTDIYDLLRWMLEQDTLEVIRACDLISNYQEAIHYVLRYVENNRHILLCSYDAVGRMGLKRFFYNDFIKIISNLVDNIEERLQLHAMNSLKKFTCEFYTEALAGMLLNYIIGEIHYTEEDVIEFIGLIIKTSLPQMLIIADEKQRYLSK